MDINRLPDVVLRMILAAAAKDGDEVGPTLAANLPLLAVCRKWRYVALRLVYSGVSIRSGNKPDSDDEGPSDSEPESTEIATNLDLVVAAGCLRTVRMVAISVHHNIDPLPGFSAVVRTMREAADRWGSVQELEIIIHSGPTAGDRYHQDEARWAEPIKQTSAALTALMPGICRIWLGGVDHYRFARELYGQITVAYAGQLRAIDSVYPIAVSSSCTFKQLMRASIRYDMDTSYRHLCIDPSRLVDLELPGWPVGFSWALFATDPGCERIEFPSLRTLGISYDCWNPVEGPEPRLPQKLCFPKLIRLEVYSAMPACPLLKHAVFPLRMDEISIIVSVPMLQSLLYMPLPTAKRLKIGISSGANRNVDSLATACRILERAQNATELGLHVHDATLPVLPESVTCTSLASLCVSANTSVDVMLGLISRLPRLTSLELRSLKLANIQADISVPKPDDDRVLGPLETNIEELTIEVRYAERQWEMLVPVVKYLLLRIPTLFTFTGKQVPKMPVMKLVRAYCGKYPHLKDVEFKLCGDDWY